MRVCEKKRKWILRGRQRRKEQEERKTEWEKGIKREREKEIKWKNEKRNLRERECVIQKGNDGIVGR